MTTNQAIEEFINNERSFISGMNDFVHLYLNPMLQSNSISPEDAQVISDYISGVEELNKSSANLALNNSETDEDFLSKVTSDNFKKHAENIIPLCLQVAKLNEIYDRQVNPPKYPSVENSEAQTFVAYPILPVQRTTRYRMTLQEALKLENRVENKNFGKIENINQAISTVHGINSKLNVQQARNDGRESALEDCKSRVDIKKKENSKQKWGMRLILSRPQPINNSQKIERDEYIKTILATVFPEHFVRKNRETFLVVQQTIQQTPIDLTNIESFAYLDNFNRDLYNILVASAPEGTYDPQVHLNALAHSLDLLTSNQLGKRSQSPVAKELLDKVERVDSESPEAQSIRQAERRITNREERPFSSRAFSAIRNFGGTTFGSPSSRSSSPISSPTKSVNTDSTDSLDSSDSEIESEGPSPKKNGSP